jgi:signal transduction histidine kinase/ligand-binding sensor domain-containing protein
MINHFILKTFSTFIFHFPPPAIRDISKLYLLSMRGLLTTVFVFCFGVIVTSQSSILFNHYTIEEGLSDNRIDDIIQDDNGFTWLATSNGLNRFDGVQFKKFFRTGNDHDLPDNYISHIRKWNDHSLVIATGHGLSIVNTQTGQCQTVLIPSQKEMSWHTNFIEGLDITSNHEIIAGTHTGVYVYNSQLKLIAGIEAGYKPEDLGKKRILFLLGMVSLNNGDLIVETVKGIRFYDHNKKTFFPLSQHPDPFYREMGAHLSRYTHHMLGTDRHNRIFCVNYYELKNKITVFDMDAHKAITSSVPDTITGEFSWVSEISFHNDSLFSINAAVNGFYLFSYDPSTLQVKVNPVKVLQSVSAKKLMLDPENRWWACTANGLYCQSLVRQQFKNLDILAYLTNRNLVEGVTATYRYRKNLYVGLESTDGGILIFDENDRFVRKIDMSSLTPGCNMIWNIDQWSEDTLIIGTQSGIVLLNTNNYHFNRINYPGWPSAANESPITTSYTDSRGTRWVGLGNTNGVLLYYSKTRTWKHFSPNDKNAVLKMRYPTNITEDKSGDIWLMQAKEGRLTRWSYQKQNFDTLIHDFEGINADDNNFNCMTADEKGNLWLYLQNQGLINWDPLKGIIKRYRVPGILQNAYAQALYTGIRGQLWVIFGQSISVINLRTDEVRTFTKINGLPDHTVTGIKFYYDSSTQHMMVGFTNSFTSFNPYEVFRTKKHGKIFITEIDLLTDTTRPDPQKTVRLKYSQNDIAIHFSAIDYENGPQNTYEYRLFENERSPWINIGRQQSINLNNLSAGKYTFQVRLASQTTSSSQQMASTSILIIPPFYRTAWFYTLCMIVLVGTIFILYRWRIQQLIQMQKVRNRISSDLHDDIGARLTNIQILSALSEQKLEQPEQASLYLRRIVNEVQTSGEALDDIVWSINSKNDQGEEFAARMRRYVAEVFEADHILYSMQVHDDFSAIKLSMEKRRDFYLVFKEALNNILKHSQASTVTIELLVQHNKAVMMIADNGKGFDVNQPTTRNGLKNMKRRIEKWKGELVIESGAGKGTVLQAALPLHEPSLKRAIWDRLRLY